MTKRMSWLLLILGLVCGCTEDDPPSPILPEGVFSELGEIMPMMSEAWQPTFDSGAQLARRRFTKKDGLGPKFNVSSCTGCHETPTGGGGGPLYRNFLLMGQRTNYGAFLLSGSRGGVYTFHHTDNVETEPQARTQTNVLAARNPIPFFGLGLLRFVSDDEILVYHDPEDADGDGISGKANFILGRVGRLGLKSQAISIEGFVRGPLMNHLGITTNPLSSEQKMALPFSQGLLQQKEAPLTAQLKQVQLAQVAAPNEPLTDEDAVSDPELAEDELFDLVAWATLLGAPKAEEPTEVSRAGKEGFHAFGCDKCHRPTLDSSIGPIPLYSDLLLHDMGDDLADGIEMGFATAREFRTAPLWGVVASAPYLHDGRAGTLDDAIRAHDGEAKASRDQYLRATETERRALLEFLASLGGRARASKGLIDPQLPVPSSGTLGASIELSNAIERTQWERGRTQFDMNISVKEGLGTSFNGDSCRACHFLGAVGGAGPIDVDVQLIQGEYEQIVRKQHHLPAELPTLVMDGQLLERRNTPPLFGLNILAAIPEEEVLSLADPDDSNLDGIAGRVALTEDGKLGRYGWRLQHSSIEDFVHEALQVELGLKPEELGATYEAQHRDLSFFIENLAPPPSASALSMPDVFGAIGCDDCHRTDLPIGSLSQPLTDLLLHDIGTGHFPPEDERNAYRTAPLWGLKESAPYLHDGRSTTIREAILNHENEASWSREAFEALSASEQGQILEFLEQR